MKYLAQWQCRIPVVRRCYSSQLLCALMERSFGYAPSVHKGVAMSNNDARRVCGIAIGLGISLVFSSDAFATRGRPKVANNTIVTDTGSLIRGARVSLDIWDETPTQADVDTIKNSRGLNAFHIYAEYPGSNKAAGYN